MTATSTELDLRAKDMPDRLARLLLSSVIEPLDRAVTPLLAGLDATEAWRRVTDPGDVRFERCRARVAALDTDVMGRLIRAHRIRVVIPGDAEWPAGFADLDAPPWCLWVRGAGRLDGLMGRSVAVVGSRASTAYGTTVARELGHDLTQAGWTVVSGAAYGIDAAAHEGALAAGRPTVAVLACGVDRAYPSGHRDLLDRIRVDGVVVSELAPAMTAMKQRFLSRNRLIAAMTAGTVVVEAGLRSGSLNTARHAGDLARPVAAVPGSVMSVTSAGTNELIRKGATLVTDAAEVLELVAPMGQQLLMPLRAPELPLDLASEEARRTRDAFPAVREVSVDTLVRVAGLTPGEVFGALGELAALGLVEQGGGGLWRRV
ncbi:DNA-processing protein DprA [Calidifontibacter terrae]